MRLRLGAFLLAAALVASVTGRAAAERVRVRVVDVAGGKVYVEPGTDKGILVGDEIDLGGKKYKVVQASASFAVVDADDPHITLDTAGFADVDTGRKPDVVKPIERPPPPSAFTGQWNAARPPADDQHPKTVPLGAPTSESPNSLAVWVSGYGVRPFYGTDAGAIVAGEIGLQLHYEPLVRAPLALDADVRADGYLGSDLGTRPGGSSRPIVRARQLEARYGEPASAFAALGRLRYASAMLGMLDGVRLQSPSLGGLTIGAFGGFVPDPLSSTPSTDATRFGGEVAFQNAKADTRWRAVVGGHASRFGGAIDERRVSALAEVLPRFGRFSAYSEVAFFDPQNPWGAHEVELSGAGGEAGVRAGPFDIGLRAAFERPERSRWLASYLPPEWFCVARPSPQPGAFCIGNDGVLSVGGDVSYRIDRTVLTLGASDSRTQNIASEQLAFYANARVTKIFRYMHVETGGTATHGTLLEGASLVVSPGVSIFDDRADISLRYRPAITRYVADGVAFIEHGVGGALWLGLLRGIDFSLDTEVVTGGYIDYLVAQGILLWRPQL